MTRRWRQSRTARPLKAALTGFGRPAQLTRSPNRPLRRRAGFSGGRDQRHRDHPGFSETVEFSVYIAPTHINQGLGAKLYSRLLEELTGEAVHLVLAGIALPNEASIQLHRNFGFEEIGIFDEHAKKWGERVSSVWMQLRC